MATFRERLQQQNIAFWSGGQPVPAKAEFIQSWRNSLAVSLTERQNLQLSLVHMIRFERRYNAAKKAVDLAASSVCEPFLPSIDWKIWRLRRYANRLARPGYICYSRPEGGS